MGRKLLHAGAIMCAWRSDAGAIGCARLAIDVVGVGSVQVDYVRRVEGVGSRVGVPGNK